MLLGSLGSIIASNTEEIVEILNNMLSPSEPTNPTSQASINPTTLPNWLIINASTIGSTTVSSSILTKTTATNTLTTGTISFIRNASIPNLGHNDSSHAIAADFTLDVTTFISILKRSPGSISDLTKIMQPDCLYIADFVIYGFFFICIVQIISILSGANVTKLVR